MRFQWKFEDQFPLDTLHCNTPGTGIGLVLPSLVYFRPALQYLGNFFSNVPYKYYIFVWSWFNTMNILSALLILMAWSFSTRASVATMLNIVEGLTIKTWLQGYSQIFQWLFFCETNSSKNKTFTTLYKYTLQISSPKIRFPQHNIHFILKLKYNFSSAANISMYMSMA